MAQQALTIASRFPKPQTFNGTGTAWRVLCDLYPAAETVEVIGAVIDYCAVRRLDPFKRPVHVVSMYNSKLRRKVQVVMQGINEVEITASRTGKWAGLDAPKWGPEVERTFRGSFENDDGSTRAIEVKLRFPEWCMVTVYRMRGEHRDPYTEQLWWEESYARAGFRSEVPNARWQQAPRQMIHKCTKAAVLRAAFPEEGFGYVAEEMEGRDTEGGGYTIEGMAEPAETDSGATPAGKPVNGAVASQAREYRPAQVAPPEAGETARERQTDVYADPPKPTGVERLENEPNQTAWLKVFHEVVATAATEDELTAIVKHWAVVEALDKAPSLIRDGMNDALRAAHERLRPAQAPDEPQQAFPGDPYVEAMIAEARAMSLDQILALPSDNDWQRRAADLFPTDYERVDLALWERRNELEKKGATPRDDDAENSTDV